MRTIAQWRLLPVLLLAALAGACGGDDDEPGPAPENHTVSLDGVLHMPGMRNPMGTCTGCHGADLLGGAEGEPSCYQCHGQKW